MKAAVRFIIALFATSFLETPPLYATHIPEGWYVGFQGEVSTQRNLNFGLPVTSIFDQNVVADLRTLFADYGININRVFVPGRIKYSMGGGFGAQAGYRLCGFRLEGEITANYSPYKQLYLNDVLFKRRVQVTTFPVIGPVITFPFTMGGSTWLFGALANLYYDLYFTDDAEWIPYAGLGIGYAYINNQFTLNFIPQTRVRNTTTPATPTSPFYTLFKYNRSNTVPVAQMIAGLSYQLDDFFSAGLDYRYLASSSVDTFTNKRLTLQSINVTFNHWFNC
ncbi:MAG: hypothetical protein H2069_03025 [Legionella sp.]|nr:hypothetical protein [Legionella sp.]